MKYHSRYHSHVTFKHSAAVSIFGIVVFANFRSVIVFISTEHQKKVQKIAKSLLKIYSTRFFKTKKWKLKKQIGAMFKFLTELEILKVW